MKGLTPLLIVVICIGMYFLYLSPWIKEIKSLALKKEEYNTVLAKTQELKDMRDAVLQDYNSISQEDIEKLNKVVPEKFDSVLFANDLNNMAVKYGLTIKSIKSNSITQSDREQVLATEETIPYRAYSISVTLTGPYAEFIKFLGTLETNLRLIDVRSLGIRYVKDEKVPTNDKSDYSLEVDIYSLR